MVNVVDTPPLWQSPNAAFHIPLTARTCQGKTAEGTHPDTSGAVSQPIPNSEMRLKLTAAMNVAAHRPA